jgi:hypothetical protein
LLFNSNGTELKRFGRVVLFLTPAAVISAGWLVFAQSPAGNNNNIKPAKTNSRNYDERASQVQLDNLITLARNAPPEVAADVLLTIGSSTLVRDKERSISLINEAFEIGGRAREPFRQRSAGLLVDTRSGFKDAASNLQLDRVSLQSKAVMKMIALDRARARAMFEQILLPSIDTLTCKDSLVPDLHHYYEVMGAIAEQCFTPQEKKSSLPTQFLVDRIEKIKSIPEITPAEKMITDSKSSPEELWLLSQVMTKALNRSAEDPRSFAFAIERDVFVSTTTRYVARLKQDSLPVHDFIEATRSFLTRNMSGEVCADSSWIKDGRESIPRSFDAINVLFAQPITPEDIHPTRVGPSREDVIYWRTPKAKALLETAKSLRFGDGTKALTPEQRNTDEWYEKLKEFLDLIGDWSSDSEASEDDYFQEKCNLYNVLAELCPDDAQRDIVLRRYASYLKESSGKYKGRIEWILPVKEYLRRLPSGGEEIRRNSLDPWLSSSDTSLRVYAELTTLMIARN